jgi:hypothetical protein
VAPTGPASTALIRLEITIQSPGTMQAIEKITK